MSARGFSLLEVIVSSTLLIAGLTGIVSALSTTTTLSTHQRNVTQALQIAESTLESLLIRSVADPDLTGGTHPATPLQFDDEGAPVLTGNGTYAVDWSVTAGPAAAPSMRRVSVRIRWTEFVGERSFSLTTLRR
jgi:Tfp pilus assembly protein PilV